MAIYIAQIKPVKEGKKLTKDKLVNFQVVRLQEMIDKAYRIWTVTGTLTAREARKIIIDGRIVNIKGMQFEFRPLLPTWENGKLYKKDKEKGNDR